jgi:hypothetical protein
MACFLLTLWKNLATGSRAAAGLPPLPLAPRRGETSPSRASLPREPTPPGRRTGFARRPLGQAPALAPAARLGPAPRLPEDCPASSGAVSPWLSGPGAPVSSRRLASAKSSLTTRYAAGALRAGDKLSPFWGGSPGSSCRRPSTGPCLPKRGSCGPGRVSGLPKRHSGDPSAKKKGSGRPPDGKGLMPAQKSPSGIVFVSPGQPI